MPNNRADNWPCRQDDTENVQIISFEELKDLSSAGQANLVVTDGWQEGPVAAVLRGGINAHAVLDVLAKAGIKDIKIFHIEKRTPGLESIFLASVVRPAHALFNNVSVI